MKRLTREQLSLLLREQRIKSRLTRELRFVPEKIDNWDELDMLAIGNRSGTEGVLLIQAIGLNILPYELTMSLKDSLTGRTKPIVCDFCYTWQQGGKAGRITFRRLRDDHSFTYLCCADLACSLHVRDKTAEALLSRSQLHEDMATEQRVARLKAKLRRIVLKLDSKPLILATD